MPATEQKGPKGGEERDDVELDLPSLDGEEEHEAADEDHDLPDTREDDGDPFDDATFGAAAGEEELATAGSGEGGWLEDAEGHAGLDIGAIDVAIQPEGKVLEEDDVDPRAGLDDLIQGDEVYVADGGEEGPLAEDEELREEDLPALDADEDGEVPDDALFDRSAIGGDDELRWADRAWAQARESSLAVAVDDESGMIAVPGDDADDKARDAAWRLLDETGRVMAATYVPGGAVVLALASPDRARAFLVRVQPDGEQRIIAEVDPRSEDDGSSCVVTGMRWDATRGCLVVAGSFGVHAYRPA
ncbi:MAG: hypothetical protein KIT84_26045 [Labilithrix sp.]|nr:hypothetical protein [Labilithrix sp.]MCW5814517.1 hypothetical protein [Labilithrix sp.]